MPITNLKINDAIFWTICCSFSHNSFGDVSFIKFCKNASSDKLTTAQQTFNHLVNKNMHNCCTLLHTARSTSYSLLGIGWLCLYVVVAFFYCYLLVAVVVFVEIYQHDCMKFIIHAVNLHVVQLPNEDLARVKRFWNRTNEKDATEVIKLLEESERNWIGLKRSHDEKWNES